MTAAVDKKRIAENHSTYEGCKTAGFEIVSYNQEELLFKIVMNLSRIANALEER